MESCLHLGLDGIIVFSGIIKSYYGSNLLKDMIEHPFNVELANNTLSIESFKFYVQQDALFLSDYIRTVLITTSKVENCNNITPLIEVAQGAMAIMRVLYNHYFAVYSINRGEKSLECFNFTNFLLSTSYNDTYEAITILYSCHFIYKVVIDSMKSKIKKNNRYKDWFDFYCGSLVESGCIALENIVDEYCQKVGGNERSRMLELFRISAQFELDFWNSAYNVSKFNQVPEEH
ncbi:TenA family protein [Wolbachia endosymbiont of Mansonella ozzardi]|uniref:TenA family protein n=1 Tax=Wolbachia endosymbiont of Mansonella ozzardi TaxID=137464 RepID=UPI001CE0AEC1